MNEQIQKLYDQLLSVPRGHIIDLTEMADSITRVLLLRKIENEHWTDAEKQKLIEYIREKNEQKSQDEQAQKTLMQTEEEIFFRNSKLLHDINIEYKIKILAEDTIWVRDFKELTPDQLENYIYWRTELRKGIMLEAPIGFMYLYLKELCGIMEHKSVQEAFEYLLNLYKIAESIEIGKKYLNILVRAIRFMSVFYYDKIVDANIYIKKYFYEKSMYESKKAFLDGKYEQCIDYINQHSAYKFQKSAFYKENSEFYNKCLIKVISEFLKICRDNQLDFIKTSIGYYKELQYKEQVFLINKAFLYEGKIDLDNEYYIRVNNGEAFETVISRGMNVDDSKEKISVMIYYLVWYLEKVIRTYKGMKRNVYPTLKKLNDLLEKEKHCDELKTLKEIYLSKTFVDMVNRVVKEEGNIEN